MIAADLLSYAQATHRDHERGSAAARVTAIWFPQAVDSDIPGGRRRAARASTNFTGTVTAVHRDAPAFPQVVHSAAHKGVLTHRGTGPSFGWQESPGSGPHVASGEGGRTARSGANGRPPCRFGARGPRPRSEPPECRNCRRSLSRCEA